MPICFLGAGSNLGDKRHNINRAIASLNSSKGVRVVAVSSFLRSKAVGGPEGQPDYLNAALKVRTTLSPRRLLATLKRTERNLGRKKGIRNGPRIIDLDILLYADMRIRTKGLQIPHPRMFEREFVVRPLLEVL